MFRTHTCGELKKENVGQKVTLSGWVNKRRDLGGLIFIDLRDRYGLTQIVINPQDLAKDESGNVFEMAEKIRSEFVINISGEVCLRPQDTKNEKMLTGEIEVKVETIKILSEVNNLPFEIASFKDNEVNEDLRLKYRYLDLRREKMQRNIMFRAKMEKFIRDYMDSHGYIHIETPLLTSSSPEGARDYLVPSRLHPGKFYALPQAPQQFKQLLMVSGFDKYYQIAACMRDEDPRADRSPGEFYQLDVETSFKTSREFFAEMEPLFIELTEKLTDKKVKEKPFPQIPYLDAMNKYGSDKPDLRFDLQMQDILDWAKSSDFKVFQTAECVKVLVVEGGEKWSRKELDEELADVAKKAKAKGLAWLKYVSGKFEGSISKFFTEDQFSELTRKLELKRDCALLMVADSWKIVVESLGKVRVKAAEKLDLIDKNLVAWAWVVDFPMYEKNEETGRIDFFHNPFSMPIGGMKSLNEMDPLEIKADQYDIVANGLELSSGAVRNYSPEIMYKAFEIAGYDKNVVEKKFGNMVSAFSFGAPPHCGFAPGIERLAMVLLDETNIREVVAFPKNGQAQDLLMGAPSEVSAEQLKELHIEIVEEKK